MAGPLAKVDTIVAGINLDVGRALYMGPKKVLEFIVPDSVQLDGWRIVLTLKKGFHRVAGKEKTDGDGSEVLFQVADKDEILDSVLAQKDLHIRVEDVIYMVGPVPPIASTEARVFNLNCKIRTKRNKFFNNGK